MIIEGVDVSRAQPASRCDWARAAEAGLKFAIVKTSEGRDYWDPEAAAQLAKLRITAPSITRGTYHLARPDNRFRESSNGRLNGQREAAWAAAMALKVRGIHGCLKPALDLEKYTDKGQVTTAQRDDFVLGYLDEYEAITGVLPATVYSGQDFWRYQHSEALAQELRARGVLLWLVSYSPKLDPPEEIPGWPWGIWQWSGGGSLNHADPWPGLPEPIDRNRYRGSASEFASLVTE